jgi:hypothetical protein
MSVTIVRKTKQTESWGCYSGFAEDMCLLSCDTISLGWFFLAFWRDCSLWCIRNCLDNDITSKMTWFFKNETVHMSKTNRSLSHHKNVPIFQSHVSLIFLNCNCPAQYKNLFRCLRYTDTYVNVNIWQSAKYVMTWGGRNVLEEFVGNDSMKL